MRDTLRATLFCDETRILGLDYHGQAGAIAIGYHWDICAPLAAAGSRIFIDPQPADTLEALDCLSFFWHIELTGAQMRLR